MQKKGVYKGIKMKSPEQFDACYKRYLSDRSYSKSQMAEDLKVSRPTIDKLIKEKKQEIKVKKDQ